MQSGISASKDLHEAFNALVSDHGQRGLIVGIEDEQLVPRESVSAQNKDFFADLDAVQALLKDDEAAYIVLRRYDNSPSGFVAVTYVPDTARTRSKMLFASTRLTLTRELGIERFRETVFVTTKAELMKEGWEKHETHGALDAPLTEEEQNLRGIKAAEAEESRGTGARSGHVSSGLTFPISDEALKALKGIASGGDNLVQLSIDTQKELIELASTSRADAHSLSSKISETEPRYTFFRYEYEYHGETLQPHVFIYTCPSASKVKERMLYASSRAGIIVTAEQNAGLMIAKKLEASDPSEVTATTVEEAFNPKQEQKSGFARPKRPGRR